MNGFKFNEIHTQIIMTPEHSETEKQEEWEKEARRWIRKGRKWYPLDPWWG